MSALQVLQVPNNDGIIPESPRQARNGVAYEMVYKPATGEKPATAGESPRVPINPEKIESKLKEAEDRRQSLEMAKIENVKARLAKIGSAREKRIEDENTFRKETQEALEHDMAVAIERREKTLLELKERLQGRLSRVRRAQESLQDKCVSLEKEIGKKLTEAEENRTQRINDIKERAQEHLLHVKEVMVQVEALTKDSEEKINGEMDRALKNREEQMGAMLQRLHEHSAKVEHLRRQRAAAAQGVPTPNPLVGDEPMQVDKPSNGTPTTKRH